MEHSNNIKINNGSAVVNFLKNKSLIYSLKNSDFSSRTKISIFILLQSSRFIL